MSPSRKKISSTQYNRRSDDLTVYQTNDPSLIPATVLATSTQIITECEEELTYTIERMMQGLSEHDEMMNRLMIKLKNGK
jgi:hypothetical protein